MSEIHLSEDEVTSLPASLIQVGIPLEFPVYDIHGRLLMQTGTVVTTEDQLERLVDRGLYLNKKTINQLRSGNTKGDASTSKNVKADGAERAEKLVDFPFNSIKLGESIQISPLTDATNNTKYIVKFLGGLEKNSLICSAPKIDEKLVYIKEHSGFLVRLFSGKDVYNFTTIVTAIYSQPYPHIHLKFPKDVYSKNLRNNQRVATSIICSLVNISSGELKETTSAGRIIDLSLGGVMVESSTVAGQINDEMECTFKLKLNDKEVLFSIPSVLRNITEPANANSARKYNQGIQFKEISFQDKAILQGYIYQLLTGKDLNNL